MAKQKLIDVMICVNNPDNGNYAGRLAGLNIHDFIDLEPVVLPEPRCTIGDGYFSVHRCRVGVYGYQQWVGNWCWNSIRVTREDAALLVSRMLSETYTDGAGKPWKVWGIQSAHGDAAIALADRLTAGDTITATDVLGAMTAEVDHA